MISNDKRTLSLPCSLSLSVNTPLDDYSDELNTNMKWMSLTNGSLVISKILLPRKTTIIIEKIAFAFDFRQCEWILNDF